MSKLIVGFGEALVDVLPTGEVVGGAPLNFSMRAAQLCQALSWQAALVTRIGADARGEQILRTLAQSPLDTSAVQVDGQWATGFVNVAIEDDQPVYRIGQHVAWDWISFDEPVADLAHRASAVCFGTLAQRSICTRSTLMSFLDAAMQAIKILDINLRQPYPEIGLVRESLQRAHVLKCNEEELLLLAKWLGLAMADQEFNPVKVAARLQTQFELDCVFWTRGPLGCVLQRGEELVEAEVPPLDREPDADSIGAGDAAAAALAVGLAANWPAEKMVQNANYCGAFAASRRGATTALRHEFLQQIASSDPAAPER